MKRYTIYKGIIRDNLEDQYRVTRPCTTEAEARKEVENKIKRLCGYYKVDVNDCRFTFECLEMH